MEQKPYDFHFNFPICLKADAEGKFYLEGYACTTDLDRQDEIILKTALEKALEDVRQNQTVFYEHKSTEYPIGKIVDSKIIDEDGSSKLYVKVYISKTAETVRTLIEEGILNKFSIGGKVLKFRKASMEGKEITEIQDMELYEVSVVGLPANIKAEAIGFEIKKSLEMNLEKKEEVKLEKTAEVLKAEKEAEEKLALEKSLEDKRIADEKAAEELKKAEELKAVEELKKSVSTYQDLPLAELGYEWDSTAAIGRVREYAGGDKRDWTKYSHAFMWFDATAKENEGSYKLPYADVISGELKAVPKAISSIVGAINGARGGVDIPEADKAKILNQCEKYQKKIEEAKPKQEQKAEDVQILDAKVVMDTLARIEATLAALAEGMKNIKVEIKKEELPVQKIEASIKPEDLEAMIKKAVDIVKEEILKSVVSTKRKGLVIQTSSKDEKPEEVIEKNDEDVIAVLEDEKAFNALDEKVQKETIRKGFLNILKRKTVED